MKEKKQKPMRIRISPLAKSEWTIKEEGSWEDHGKPISGHVYCILTNHKRDILIHSEGEYKILMLSANYHTSGSWDKGESKAQDSLMKACDRISQIKFKLP